MIKRASSIDELLCFSLHSFQRVSVILFETQLGLLYWRLDTITNSWSSMYRMHVHMLWYEYMTIICYIWILRFHWFKTNSDTKLNPQIDTEPILIGIESSNSPSFSYRLFVRILVFIKSDPLIQFCDLVFKILVDFFKSILSLKETIRISYSW